MYESRAQPLDEGLLEDVPYLKLWGTSNPHNTHQANLWLGKGTCFCWADSKHPQLRGSSYET